MAKFSIPPKPNRTKQVVASVVVLLMVVIVAALLGKLLVGFIIFLLGAVLGIGSQMVGGPLDNPLDKDQE